MPWVVPKSYRPKGLPRNTRNEFPIRADFGNMIMISHPIWRPKRSEKRDFGLNFVAARF